MNLLKKRISPYISKLTKQVVLAAFNQMEAKAYSESECKKKHVGVSILEIVILDERITHFAATNGPVNIVSECFGGDDCICVHAEAKALTRYAEMKKRLAESGYVRGISKTSDRQFTKSIGTILVSTTCPCRDCANLIIKSGLIDVVIYDGPYDTHAGLGAKILDISHDVRLWTREMIEHDIENNYIKHWFKTIAWKAGLNDSFSK